MKSSLIGPWIPTQISSTVSERVSSSLFGTIFAACHLVHLQIICRMTNLWMKSRSHSTCWLNLSGRFTLHTLCGPGFVHCRQTLHVSQISGMRLRTSSDTPTLSKNRFITGADACHQRTCSLRRVSLWRPTPPVRNRRTTFPMSKFDQSEGFSGLVPVSCQVRRSRGTVSGPRPRLLPAGAEEELLPPAPSAASALSSSSATFLASSASRLSIPEFLARRRASRRSCS